MNWWVEFANDRRYTTPHDPATCVGSCCDFVPDPLPIARVRRTAFLTRLKTRLRRERSL